MRTRAHRCDDEPGPYTIAMTRDVLVIEVPLTYARYPTRNDESAGAARYSAKTPWYRKLFATVVAASADAVAQGWTTIDTPCDFTVTRICTDYRVRDAMNLGGCEANALTRGGAWTDDTLAAPVHVDIQVDPEGPDRISIVLRRQHPRSVAPRAARPLGEKKARGRRRASGEPLVRVRSEAAAPSGRRAVVDGEVVLTKEQTAAVLRRYLGSR